MNISSANIIIAAVFLVIGNGIGGKISTGILSNIVTALATGIMAGVALKGLSLWKKQAKWNAGYYLAKRLLKLAHQYSDAIYHFRISPLKTSEISDPLTRKLADQECLDENKHGIYWGTLCIYQARSEIVANVRYELYPEIVEGEALWGESDNALRAFDRLFELEKELNFYVSTTLQLENPDATPEERKQCKIILDARRDIQFANSKNPDEDEFSADVSEALGNIVESLRSRLAS